jgi:hypothetical protein
MFVASVGRPSALIYTHSPQFETAETGSNSANIEAPSQARRTSAVAAA